MKDKQIILWLWHKTRKQHLPILLLIVTNGFYSACGVIFALISKKVIDRATEGNRQELLLQGLFLLFVMLLQFTLRIVSQQGEVKVQGKLELFFKSYIFGQLLEKDYARTTKYHSGELMNRLVSDITVISEGIATILPKVSSLITRLVFAFLVLSMFNITFGIIFLFAGIILYFTTKVLRTKLKYLHKSMQEKEGLSRSFLQEVLENLLVIKVFRVEQEMVHKTEEHLQVHLKAKYKKSFFSIVANSGFSFVFSLGYLYALVWSSLGIVANTLTFGTLTAVLQLVGQIQSPFAGLSGLLPKTYDVFASAERIIELEKLPDEREYNKEYVSSAQYQDLYTQMAQIRFEQVSFSYEKKKVLDRADFVMKKGDFILLSGASGIGKSTMFKLLLGVLPQEQGEIYFQCTNGTRLPIDKYIRRLFAYVPQGNLLLSGTIRENIKFVKPNATEKEIMKAAQISCATDFIEALPDQLDTLIGEKGRGLSEGQVQRIAIARAILSGAPILLLDEATSALDEETEGKLLENLKNMTDITCFMISHKRAALAVCNCEIFMQNGSLFYLERRGEDGNYSAGK